MRTDDVIVESKEWKMPWKIYHRPFETSRMFLYNGTNTMFTMVLCTNGMMYNGTKEISIRMFFRLMTKQANFGASQLVLSLRQRI